MASASLTSSRPNSPASTTKSNSVSNATPIGRAIPADLDQGSERRASVRYTCSLETSCAPLAAGAGTTWVANVCNISKGGLALLMNRRFEPKTILKLQLSDPKDDCPLDFLVRVAYVTKDASGDWSHGCEFMSKLSDEEVKAML